jgi:hypothetical protein
MSTLLPRNAGKTAAGARRSPNPESQIARLKTALGIASALAVLALAAATVIYFRFSTTRPLVTVGGRTISKREYQAVLDQQAGKKVLGDMVYGELIRQAATKAGLMPTTAEVEARMALVQQNNPQAVQASVATLGVPGFREQVTTTLALENLRMQGLSASSAEIARFYATHQAGFLQRGHGEVALIQTSSATDSQTAAQLLRQGVDPRVIAKQPSFHLNGYQGFSVDTRLPAAQEALKSVGKMKAGDVQVHPFGKQFLTVKMVSQQAARLQPLSEVQPQVARLVRLAKAPPADVVVAHLYKTNPPVFALDKYVAYFDDVNKVKVQPRAAH